MRYTPVELRHVRIGRALFGGYKRAGDRSACSTTSPTASRTSGASAASSPTSSRTSRSQLDEVKQRETLLASTLDLGGEGRRRGEGARAKREAEVIVAEAHQEARSITRAAQAERERLFAEVAPRSRRCCARRSASSRRSRTEAVAATRSVPTAGEHWPNREDTREFQAVTARGPPTRRAVPADARGRRSRCRRRCRLAAKSADGDVPWAGRDFAWG